MSHVDDTTLCRLGAVEQARLLRSGGVEPTALLDACLRRIGRSATVFSVLDEAGARASARDADRRIAAGERLPLLGVPVAVQDGEPVPEALAAAGAVLIGRTSPVERYANPLWANGFSSGELPVSGTAAAVAAGVVSLALASGAPGRGRVPAGAVGLVGYQSGSAGSGTGVLARSADDVVLALEALGLRSGQPVVLPPVRVGVSLRGLALHNRARPAMRTAVLDVASLFSLHGNVVHDHDAESHDPARILLAPHLAATPGELRALGRVVPEPLRGLCRRMATAERSLVDDMFRDVDVLVTPGHTGPPRRVSLSSGTALVRTGATTPFNALWRISGYPALSLRAAWSREGRALPVQLTAAPHARSALFALARLVERNRVGDGADEVA